MSRGDSERLRPIDLARATGVSTQTVRMYEQYGFLPSAERSATGYRRYTSRHLQAMCVARLAVSGFGWEQARRIMSCLHTGQGGRALSLVDACHADLYAQRTESERIVDALVSITQGPQFTHQAQTGRNFHILGIGEAARKVGVRTSTLRYWEAQGVLRPARDPRTGRRTFGEAELARVELVALLRRAGYGLAAVAELAPALENQLPSVERLRAAAYTRLRQLDNASQRCSRATAAVWDYLKGLGLNGS
jgi:DNA-binding transcriptional MerR regulator